MKLGSLFSGIGGFDLAAQWMGWTTSWYSEIDPYCNAVMAHHFPEARALGDITQIDWSGVEPVDLLCGGFPCQDVSVAGKRAGITGARSGLWSEFARAIRDLRPRYVVVENVPGLLTRGMGDVLRDLAVSGYDAEWTVLSAADVGAPHLRERIWIVAAPAPFPDALDHALRELRQWIGEQRGLARTAVAGDNGEEGSLADAESISRGLPGSAREEGPNAGGRGEDVADPNSERRDEGRPEQPPRQWGSEVVGAGPSLPDSISVGFEKGHRPTTAPQGQSQSRDAGQLPQGSGGRDWWETEPDVGRLAHGVPHRVAQLRALGNAIVPQCASQIFQAIEAAESRVVA